MIINADDYGLNRTKSRNIILSFDEKVIDRCTCIVNTDFSDECINFLPEKYKGKVGLHISLISGHPLSEKMMNCTQLVKDGTFKNKNIRYFWFRLHLRKKVKEAVVDEINKQIDCFLNYGFILKHFDSHGNVHLYPCLYKIFANILAERGFVSCRGTTINERNFVKRLLHKKINNYYSKKISRLERYSDPFRKITNDELLEIMVHPEIKEEKIYERDSNILLSSIALKKSEAKK